MFGGILLKKIGVALVGSSFLADIFAECYKTIPNVELVAVSSRKKLNAKKFADRHGVKSWYGSYDKMFKRDDIDAVNICVPNYLHAPVTISAAESGKHILCTKPLAISTKQAEDMVETCKHQNVILMYGENWVFTPATKRVKEIIEQNGLGKILAIEAREQHSGSHSPFATKKEFCGGGALIHLAVHPIGFIMHIMNQPVKRIYAELANLLHNTEGEDQAIVLLRFKNEGSGVAQSNYVTKGGMQDRIEIYGTEGLAFMNVTHSNLVQIYSETGYSYAVEKASTSRGWTNPVVNERIQFGFANMIEHFAECVTKDREPITTGAFGKEVLEIIFAAYKSYDMKRSIQFDTDL